MIGGEVLVNNWPRYTKDVHKHHLACAFPLMQLATETALMSVLLGPAKMDCCDSVYANMTGCCFEHKADTFRHRQINVKECMFKTEMPAAFEGIQLKKTQEIS